MQSCPLHLVSCGKGFILTDCGVLVLCLLLTGCGRAHVPHHGTYDRPGAADARTAEPCLLRETSRRRLVLEGGRTAYVEPAVLRGSANGDFLLAGRHNYQFEKVEGGAWRVVRSDSLLGAVVPRGGRARAVLAPFPSARLNGVRAVELDGGGWAVVFAEVPDSGEEVRPDSAVRLWYGVHDGRRWTTLEPMPMPARGTLHPADASSLVRRGRDLAWAMTVSAPWGRWQIILYQRRDGRWSYEQVPTSHAQVELAYADSLGLLLAVVQADPRRRSDGNSLLLWTRQPDWRILRSVVPGDRERVYRPSLRFTPTEGVLTWIAAVSRPDGGRTWEAHAMQGQITGGDPRVIVLDTVPGPFEPPIPLELSTGRRVWVVGHVREGAGERSIQFLHADRGVPASVGWIPNPYVTSIAAETLSPSEVLIAGGVLDSAEQVVSSLLIRVRVGCAPPVE